MTPAARGTAAVGADDSDVSYVIGSGGDWAGGGGDGNCSAGTFDLEVKLMAWQLARALKGLHDFKVVHRDVRPANILLGDNGALNLLCDFGSARVLTSARGTIRDVVYPISRPPSARWYLAPEVLTGHCYGLSADIWSFGCTVAELAIGQPLLRGSSHADQLLRVMRFCSLPPFDPYGILRKKLSAAADASGADGGRGSSSEDLHRLVRLLESCLRLDPNDRPTADQILKSPYFADVHDLVRGAGLEALLYDDDQEEEHDNDVSAERISEALPLLPPPASAAAAVAEKTTMSPRGSCGRCHNSTPGSCGLAPIINAARRPLQQPAQRTTAAVLMQTSTIVQPQQPQQPQVRGDSSSTVGGSSCAVGGSSSTVGDRSSTVVGGSSSTVAGSDKTARGSGSAAAGSGSLATGDSSAGDVSSSSGVGAISGSGERRSSMQSSGLSGVSQYCLGSGPPTLAASRANPVSSTAPAVLHSAEAGQLGDGGM